jgi:hypothetical protein
LSRESGNRPHTAKMTATALRAFAALVLIALAGCADPATERAKREREDARLAVLGDAVFYWRCAHQAVVEAGGCWQWSEAYERDKAALLAKFGEH